MPSPLKKNSDFYLVVDFTLSRENVVTGLKIRDFFRSSIDGLDKLRAAKGLIPLRESLGNQLRRRYPTAIYLQEQFDCDAQGVRGPKLSFHDFVISRSADYTIRDKAPRDLIPKLLYSRADLGATQAYRQPLIASLSSTRLPAKFRTPLEQLQKKEGNNLRIFNYPGGVLPDACTDKVVFTRFTEDSSLCPPSLFLDLKQDCTQELQAFLAQNKDAFFVLKPSNSSNSKGVHILSLQQVAPVIERLRYMASSCMPACFSSCEQMPVSGVEDFIDLAFWQGLIIQDNHFALLQVACPSKRIVYEEKFYRPTGRTVIEARFHNNATLPTLNFLGSYWELPVDAVGKEPSTRSLVLSDAPNPITLDIGLEDWQVIQRQLSQELPKVLLNMYNTPFAHLRNYFMETRALQAYQRVLSIDSDSCEQYGKLPMSAQINTYFDYLQYIGHGPDEHLAVFKEAISSAHAIPPEPKVSKHKDRLFSGSKHSVAPSTGELFNLAICSVLAMPIVVAEQKTPVAEYSSLLNTRKRVPEPSAKEGRLTPVKEEPAATDFAACCSMM